jgi:hypothetical protein
MDTLKQKGYRINLYQPPMRNMVFGDLKRRWDDMSEFEQTEICKTFMDNYGLDEVTDEQR